jgi:formate dehydrogenase maturation protein FdhE
VPPTSNSRLRWDERSARAARLADRHPATAGLLTFYALLTRYQGSLAERWAPVLERRPAIDSFPAALDTALVLDAVQDTLRWLGQSAPPGLVHVIGGLHELRPPDWHTHLDRYLEGATDSDVEEAPGVFLLETILQPLAELLALRASLASRAPSSEPRVLSPEARCRFCGSLPVVGVLREEGHGTRRTLLCGLCLSEWTYLRIVCPSCGERKFDALPVYTAEQVAGARVEGCDSCRSYLKTIDATKDGFAVPLVDDIATLTLDLWAREQGYVRLRANLLRT